MTATNQFALAAVLQHLANNPGERITLRNGTEYAMYVERGMFVHLYGVGEDEQGGPQIACTPFYNDNDFIPFDKFVADGGDSVHMGDIEFDVRADMAVGLDAGYDEDDARAEIFTQYKHLVVRFLDMYTDEWREVETIEVSACTAHGNSTWLRVIFEENVDNNKFMRARVFGSIYGDEMRFMEVSKANSLLAFYARH